MHAPLPSTLGPQDAAGHPKEGAHDGIAVPDAQHSNENAAHSADALTDSRIGMLLQRAGKLSAESIERVLRVQKESGLHFGAVAQRLGLVDQVDIDAAIAGQFAYPVAVTGGSQLSPQLIVAFQPASTQSDTLRAIRSQLLLRWFGMGRHGLTVTGAGMGDASSVLTANLALVFAQLGHRTLLVDANLQHGIQHTLFGLHARVREPSSDMPGSDAAWTAQSSPAASLTDALLPHPAWTARAQPGQLGSGDACGDAAWTSDSRPGPSWPGLSWPGPSWPGPSWPGLSDILGGRTGLNAIIPVPGFPTLSLLPSGTVPPNPQELLERASFSALHRQLGKAYDVVLYDVAPTPNGAEALAVAMHSGAVLLVAQKDRTPVAALKRVAQQMTSANVTVIGSVLVEA